MWVIGVGSVDYNPRTLLIARRRRHVQGCRRVHDFGLIKTSQSGILHRLDFRDRFGYARWLFFVIEIEDSLIVCLV